LKPAVTWVAFFAEMVHKVVMHFLGDGDVKDVGIVEIRMYEIWFTMDLKDLIV
jgi:hypothetical protein